MMNDKFLLSGQYRELLSKHGIDVGAPCAGRTSRKICLPIRLRP